MDDKAQLEGKFQDLVHELGENLRPRDAFKDSVKELVKIANSLRSPSSPHSYSPTGTGGILDTDSGGFVCISADLKFFEKSVGLSEHRVWVTKRRVKEADRLRAAPSRPFKPSVASLVGWDSLRVFALTLQGLVGELLKLRLVNKSARHYCDEKIVAILNSGDHLMVQQVFDPRVYPLARFSLLKQLMDGRGSWYSDPLVEPELHPIRTALFWSILRQTLLKPPRSVLEYQDMQFFCITKCSNAQVFENLIMEDRAGVQLYGTIESHDAWYRRETRLSPRIVIWCYIIPSGVALIPLLMAVMLIMAVQDSYKNFGLYIGYGLGVWALVPISLCLVTLGSRIARTGCWGRCE